MNIGDEDVMLTRRSKDASALGNADDDNYDADDDDDDMEASRRAAAGLRDLEEEADLVGYSQLVGLEQATDIKELNSNAGEGLGGFGVGFRAGVC
eukprot:jgi/Chrzof1/3674/Cz13g04180.t1